MDPSEKLFVVHVHSGKKDRWDAGGPLLPNMSTALARYPHRVVELEKVPQACHQTYTNLFTGMVCAASGVLHSTHALLVRASACHHHLASITSLRLHARPSCSCSPYEAC